MRVYCVDDGSTDGTAEAVSQFPEVTVIPGDGSLFWARAMSIAEAEALQDEPDYVLWLNDDTMVFPGAIDALLQVCQQNPNSIAVAGTCDPDTGALTYAARRRLSSWHPQRFERLPVSDRIQQADTFNGNLVLVPRAVSELVGPIDGEFPHSYADDDYGLRATRLGIAVLQAPGFLAECPPNPGSIRPARGTQAWRDLQSPKGLPWRAQARFLRRHGPFWWPAILAGQYAARLVGRPPQQG